MTETIKKLEAGIRRAVQFIENGVELGYITMPDPGFVEDPANETLGHLKSLVTFNETRPDNCRHRQWDETGAGPKSGCPVDGCKGVFGAICEGYVPEDPKKDGRYVLMAQGRPGFYYKPGGRGYTVNLFAAEYYTLDEVAKRCSYPNAVDFMSFADALNWQNMLKSAPHPYCEICENTGRVQAVPEGSVPDGELMSYTPCVDCPRGAGRPAISI